MIEFTSILFKYPFKIILHKLLFDNIFCKVIYGIKKTMFIAVKCFKCGNLNHLMRLFCAFVGATK